MRRTLKLLLAAAPCQDYTRQGNGKATWQKRVQNGRARSMMVSKYFLALWRFAWTGERAI